jgi:hypothetical protein
MMCWYLLDHAIRDSEQFVWNCEAERLGGPEHRLLRPRRLMDFDLQSLEHLRAAIDAAN